MLLATALVSGLLLGALYALFAIGLNLQFGVARVMNLASGDVVIAGAFLGLLAFNVAGISPLVALVPVTVAGGLVSTALYAGLIRPLARRAASARAFEADTILATFGILFVLQGTMNLIGGGGYQGLSYLAVPVEVAGIVLPANRVVAGAVSVALTLTLVAFLYRTRFGMTVRALAIAPESAPLVGIDAARTAALVFGLGGAIACGAGVLVSMFLAFNASMGVVFTMKALIVVVIGGVGNLPGTFAAGILIGVTEALTASLFDPGLTQVVSFAIFMAVLVWRPEGLFGGVR